MYSRVRRQLLDFMAVHEEQCVCESGASPCSFLLMGLCEVVSVSHNILKLSGQ
jgi:hypothetical protein